MPKISIKVESVNFLARKSTFRLIFGIYLVDYSHTNRKKAEFIFPIMVTFNETNKQLSKKDYPFWIICAT